MKFKDLDLDPALLRAIDDQGYDQPSPIQEKAIPIVLQGSDIMAAAQTGTGKTAGFTLPVLHRLIHTEKPTVKGNQARVLVLTPTRELAAQIAKSVETYSKYVKIKSAVVFGGVGINPQMKRLRGGVDVLIATPGRLLDLHQQNAVQFDKLEVLVLDEADRMLDMGFIHDIRRIIKLLPKKRQTLLFSATFSGQIRELAKTFLFKPKEVSVSPANSTVDTVDQLIIPVEKADKTDLLAHLIKDRDWFQVLVFSRTKHGANKLVKKLESRGIEAAAIHGNKSQGARTKALAEFKSAKLRVLVATDIAARGIDISQLPNVVNFDLPQVAEDYVHRIGRTGRAGASGSAVSLVSHDEFKQLRDIESLIRKVITRQEIEGFEPKNQLPASSKDFKAIKAPRPKKPKASSAEQHRAKPAPKGRRNRNRSAESEGRGSKNSNSSKTGSKARNSKGGPDKNAASQGAKGESKRPNRQRRSGANASPTKPKNKFVG